MSCKHYNSPLDIVSLRFKCCGHVYPCHLCHEEQERHPIERWEEAEFETKAIFCGNCKKAMTIARYLSCNDRCPYCRAAFNPRCKAHRDLYFSLSCS